MSTLLPPQAKRVIMHVDADAFFASCEQAMHPEWKGRPVITGAERGIVSAASYEAKARGVGRGTPLWDVKKLCPDAIIVPSDYESYSLFSERMFACVRRFTDEMEEYSIDEAFADLTGLDRPFGMPVEEVARCIKMDIEKNLGITVSVGLASTKTLAKVGSKWNKPAGFTVITPETRADFLGKLSVDKIWGIGNRTGIKCNALGLMTALDFANCPAGVIRDNFAKPYQETWQELNGVCALPLVTETKTTYDSISKTKTFTPPSTDFNYVRAQLLKNLENACIKARRHGLAATGIIGYVITQDFRSSARETRLVRPTAFTIELTAVAEKMARELYRANTPYRATGIVLTGLQSAGTTQLDLFEKPTNVDKMTKVHAAVDALAKRFGKHCVHVAEADAAHHERANLPAYGSMSVVRTRDTWRSQNRLPGETKRRHLAVPTLSG